MTTPTLAEQIVHQRHRAEPYPFDVPVETAILASLQEFDRIRKVKVPEPVGMKVALGSPGNIDGRTPFMWWKPIAEGTKLYGPEVLDALRKAEANLAAAHSTIDTCDMLGHKYAKLPGHPMKDGHPQCPNCMAIGLQLARDELAAARLRANQRIAYEGKTIHEHFDRWHRPIRRPGYVTGGLMRYLARKLLSAMDLCADWWNLPAGLWHRVRWSLIRYLR